MAKYVTKTIVATKGNVLGFNLENNTLENRTRTISGKASDKDFEKAFKNDDAFKFIKVDSTETVETLRRMEDTTFTAYAREIKPGESRTNLVTRTMYEYKTTVLCYNLLTDSLEEKVLPWEIKDVRKVELIDYVCIKTLDVKTIEHLYGMTIDCFIAHSEEFER